MKPSLPPVSKSSLSSALEPLIAKPTQGELRARLKVLAKRKKCVKRKTQASPEGCPPARGKILKVGSLLCLSLLSELEIPQEGCGPYPIHGPARLAFKWKEKCEKKM